MFHKNKRSILFGKWVVMARKSQEIKIVVHEAPNMIEIFNGEEVVEFWIEKAKIRISNSNLSKECIKLLETRLGGYDS